jgi:hypothetical protein
MQLFPMNRRHLINILYVITLSKVTFTSLFRSLGGQRRRPGANYRKKIRTCRRIFYSVLTFLPNNALPRVRANFGASWAPSQQTGPAVQKCTLSKLHG